MKLPMPNKTLEPIPFLPLPHKSNKTIIYLLLAIKKKKKKEKNKEVTNQRVWLVSSGHWPLATRPVRIRTSVQSWTRVCIATCLVALAIEHKLHPQSNIQTPPSEWDFSFLRFLPFPLLSIILFFDHLHTLSLSPLSLSLSKKLTLLGFLYSFSSFST